MNFNPDYCTQEVISSNEDGSLHIYNDYDIIMVEQELDEDTLNILSLGVDEARALAYALLEMTGE